MALYSMPKNSRKFFCNLTKEDVTSIDEIDNVVGRMNKLVSLLEIPSDQYETRRKECAELREVLRKYYPDCMLLPFGSTVNGFGIKASDLDLLFLPFPGYCNVDFAPKEIKPKDKETKQRDKETKLTLPDPATILSGETPKDALTKLDEFSHLMFIKNILKKEKKLVQRHYIIPSKHSPTLRANFASSKIVCDLAASNRLVVYNSELLELYGKVDPRVKPLIITLRFWAQALGLMRKNYFSSYAFSLMVIFFLQNIKPPILVPARRFIEMAGYNRMIAGWQTAISDVPPPKTRNSESLEDLMSHFFQFYWNFDFSQHIISVYHGKVLPIKDLKNSSDKRMEDFLIAAVNIQDPFVLNRNCCRKEGSHSVLKLSLYTAYQILQDKSGKFKFSMLFDVNVYDKLFSLHFNKHLFGKEKVFCVNLDYSCHSTLIKTMKGKSSTWYEKAVQAIFDIMQYGLLMDCEVTDEMSWDVKNSNDAMETNGVSVINLIDTAKENNSAFDLDLLISMQCFVYTRVWMGRKQIADLKMEVKDEDAEEFSHAVLKEEYQLSKALIKNNPVIDSPQPLLCFKCECYKHSSPQISDIVVILRPLTASKEFHTVATFLQSYLNKMVKKIVSTA